MPLKTYEFKNGTGAIDLTYRNSPLQFVPIEQTEFIMDSSDPNKTYYGRCEAGGVKGSHFDLPIWQIWITDANGSQIFANGDGENMSYVWNNRAGYF